ncbi:hypothetical protein OAC97_03320 [Flavobacteriaceae bacterium]|nr:hypothetical protein [Flavobacteriaceae bacterium]
MRRSQTLHRCAKSPDLAQHGVFKALKAEIQFNVKLENNRIEIA